MKTVSKLMALHSSLHGMQKYGHRLWTMVFLSFLTLGSLFVMLLYEVHSFRSNTAEASRALNSGNRNTEAIIPPQALRALVHYATDNSSATQMRPEDVAVIAHLVLQKSPCNFLVFGLGHESLLWKTLNFAGRTVFVDDNEVWVNRFEEMFPGAEAYDIQYTTKVSEHKELLKLAREQRNGECRSVQNLLFSDCRLGINDLPNEVYDVEWDVVLIDGPRGYFSKAPGRMSAIFTSGVLARSKKSKNSFTDVFVHDFNRVVERAFSEEFLCKENLVFSNQLLGHFKIRPPTRRESNTQFCKDVPSLPSQIHVDFKRRYSRIVH